MNTVFDEIKENMSSVRKGLKIAFDVAGAQIVNGKPILSETMHNIFDAINAAVETLAESVEMLAKRVEDGEKR